LALFVLNGGWPVADPRRTFGNRRGDIIMTGKTLTIALALLAAATATAMAQSQRNYGPDGPSAYGCYGQAFTGTVASQCPGTPGSTAWQQPQWQQPRWQPQPPQRWQPQPWQR
jgi:hypothetical protein